MFQSDGGGEYISGNTRGVFVANGTRFVTTAPSSSNQNAIAERANRTLQESARAMMEQAGAFRSLWQEALMFAAFVRNLTPHAANNMQPPAARFPLPWMQSARLSASVRVWGCKCFVHKKDDKLAHTSLPGVFVGVDIVTKGWRVLLKGSRKIVVFGRYRT